MAVRPIDASRFGEILEQWKKDCLEDNDTQGADIISDVILQLDDMPTLTPPNEWVSVEERLPGSQEDVLVVAFWHECWQTMIGWHSDAGKKWRVITPHGEREPGGVSHWMPIPAPPDRRPPEGEEDTQ